MLLLKGSTKQTDRHVESVLAALAVLDCFLSTPFMTIKQLMDCTDFTRNRIMRLTGTLLHKGYLILDTNRAAFLPGPKIRALNKIFEQGGGVVLLARPILREVALKTRESVSLYVQDGLERVVLVHEQGIQTVRHTRTEGQRVELYTGAGGKVLLAYSPKEVLEALLSGPAFVKLTPHTVTDPAVLQRQIKKVRQQGFAKSVGESVADAGAVAAPVFDGAKDLVGALCIEGPMSRFTPETRKLYVKIAVEAAKKLSEQLGWKDIR
jgi:DNA-binding IclR family transcriptional regulator